MQTEFIVSRLLRCCEPLMHAARWQALCDVAVSAVNGSALTLSALALGTLRHATLRHRVKCVDRLLANAHLDIERTAVYRALAHAWLSRLPQLLIVVDWSSLTADLKWHWLRASVVVEGRSITLYEEVHPRHDLSARGVHRQFIKRLAAILPPNGRSPIVLTDAGFRTPWFRMVAAQGWHWIGRTRNRDFVRQPGGPWIPAKQLYARATAKAQDLGSFEAVRNRPLVCRFALIKHRPTGRKHRYPRQGEEQLHDAQDRAALSGAVAHQLLPSTCSPGGLGNREAVRAAHAYRAAIPRHQESRIGHGPRAVEEPQPAAPAGAAADRADCRTGQTPDW